MLRQIFRPKPFLAALITSAAGTLTFVVVYCYFAFSDVVVPGVRFQGQDLSGRTAEQVFAIALKQNAYFEGATLTVDVGGTTQRMRPVEFGSYADAAAVMRAAWRIGRSGDVWTQVRERARVYWYGVDLALVVHIDAWAAAARVAQLAQNFDTPVIDADLALDSAGGAVRETAAQNGVSIDQAAAVKLIEAAIRARRVEPVVLPTISTLPRIASTTEAAAQLARMVENDLVVTLPISGDGSSAQPPVEAFRISRDDLRKYVYVEKNATDAGDVVLRIGFRRDELRARIEPFGRLITGTLEDAHFAFDEQTQQLKVIKPATLGRAIDVEGTLDAIEAALRDAGAERRVTIATRQVEPRYSDRTTAAELGITRLITQATTFFRGSSAARIANVKLAASRFNGVLVPPGEVFSFNKFLGNVSKEDGFEEGLIIVGNRTEKGVGGGVCQVSTTAFQAALRAGFPIIERYPHGYRVSYYENGMGAGYDAAVFTPVADMKFRNDTQSHLLIETAFDPKNVTLTFRFFGTSDGRVVEIGAPNISKVVPHEPDLYEPDLENVVAPGEVKQVEHATDGATISFTRKVTRGGAVLIDEMITSRYVPWRNVFRFGPGFVLPEGAIVATPEPTPTPAADATPQPAP